MKKITIKENDIKDKLMDLVLNEGYEVTIRRSIPLKKIKEDVNENNTQRYK